MLVLLEGKLAEIHVGELCGVLLRNAHQWGEKRPNIRLKNTDYLDDGLRNPIGEVSAARDHDPGTAVLRKDCLREETKVGNLNRPSEHADDRPARRRTDESRSRAR